MMPAAYRGLSRNWSRARSCPRSVGVNRLRKWHSGPTWDPSLELCDSLYLDDGHTLIVSTLPPRDRRTLRAYSGRSPYGCLRPRKAGNATQEPGSLPRSRSRVPEPGPAPVGRAS
jgi:hypothetical protein